MKLNNIFAAGSLAVLVAAAVPTIASAADATIKVDGSSTVFPITEAVAENGWPHTAMASGVPVMSRFITP